MVLWVVAILGGWFACGFIALAIRLYDVRQLKKHDTKVTYELYELIVTVIGGLLALLALLFVERPYVYAWVRETDRELQQLKRRLEWEARARPPGEE